MNRTSSRRGSSTRDRSTRERRVKASMKAQNAIRHNGGTAAEHLEALAADLKLRVRDMVDVGKTRVTEFRDGFQGSVRHKPIQSILIAAAAGALIGLIVRRRM